jgi:hypothetical protein
VKAVKYLDVFYEVPDNHNFIAADDTGEVYSYTHAPIKINEHYAVQQGEAQYVGEVEMEYPVQEIK